MLLTYTSSCPPPNIYHDPKVAPQFPSAKDAADITQNAEVLTRSWHVDDGCASSVERSSSIRGRDTRDCDCSRQAVHHGICHVTAESTADVAVVPVSTAQPVPTLYQQLLIQV